MDEILPVERDLGLLGSHFGAWIYVVTETSELESGRHTRSVVTIEFKLDGIFIKYARMDCAEEAIKITFDAVVGTVLY